MGMKVKICVLTLLVVGLIFGFAVNSYALLTVTANSDASKDFVAGQKNVVVASFKVTDSDAADVLLTFAVNFAAGTNQLGASEASRVAILNDVNGDGAYNSGDTVVIEQKTQATVNTIVAGGAYTFDCVDISFDLAAVKNYLLVIDMAETGTFTDNDAIDASVNVTASVAAGAVYDGSLDDTLIIEASHLKWVTSNLTLRQLTTVEILPVVGDTQAVLLAVDDYGNVDGDFVEGILLTAKNMFTGADEDVALTAIGGGSADMTTGGRAVLMSAGLLISGVATPGPANDIESLKINTTGTSTKAFAIVARSQTKKLVGTTTVNIAASYTAATGIANARGIEIYDTDHDGHIDHATLIWNQPVDGSAAGTADFTVAGYTIASVATSPFDAGGTGIVNVGQYGVTLKLTEISGYDTNAKPEVQYIGTSVMDKVVPTAVPTVNTAQAVEVDKARPVITATTVYTRDNGTGTGTASNGKLDGIEIKLSEPIRNYIAGADSAGKGLYIDPTAGIAFNQGNGTLVGSTLTIPVGETTINTGATPDILYNAAHSTTDNATSATGAESFNNFWPDKTNYSVETSFATTDGAPMVVYQVETKDNDSSGRLDRIAVTFSEDPVIPAGTAGNKGVQFYSDISAFASGSSANGVYLTHATTGPTTSGATVTFVIQPVTTTDVYDTEAVPNFQYDPNEDGSEIKDAAGNELASYGPSGIQHEATVDGAVGVVVKQITRDAYTDTTYAGGGSFYATGANGRLDTIELVFSEQVKTNDGAQNGGSALDTVVGGFTFTHATTATTRTIWTSSSALGKPKWLNTNNNGDTSSQLTFSFQEISHADCPINKGDTGVKTHTIAVAAPTAANQIRDVNNTDNEWDNTTFNTKVDGAAPFLADGLGKNWGANAFASVVTVDSDSTVIRNTLDTGNGNGYIDGFKLYFTEAVWYASTAADSLNKFTVDLPGDGSLIFKKAGGISGGSAAGVVTLLGCPDYKGNPDTDATPALSFDAKYAIFDGGNATYDAGENVVAAFSNKLSADGAKPVIVSVNSGAALNLLKMTFSEPVTGYYTSTTINAPVDSLNKASNNMFGYENLSTGVGATGFTTAYVTYEVGTQEKLVATLNANLTADDIADDLVWIRTTGLYDNANALESGLSDNEAVYSIAGSNIKVIIFDDVVAPWISAAKTVDIDGDGLIDYIRFELSENIDDSTIKGYVSDDAMSADVSATWKVSGYTGAAYWNFFRGDKDAGKLAAAAAGKPAFGDNTADDNVLYLELNESLVPAYSVTGMGSTGFAPTITWGTATAAVTLSDFRPNVLNTAADPTDTTPKAVNGVVTDAVGPVLMSAEYAAPAAKVAKETGGTVTMYFSEEIRERTKELKTADFYYSGDGSTAATEYIWGFEWINAGTLELTFKSDHSFAVSSAPSIQIDNARYFDDAKETDALVKGACPYAAANFYTAISPIHDPPWLLTTAVAHGAVTISGLPWLDYNKCVPSTLTAGEPIDILWTYANATDVDLYISYNSGTDWKLVEGSTTPAADKLLSWVPQLNVNAFKLQAAEDATINSGTISCSVISDFNANNGGATVGAPSGLAMTDMPNDNGAFLIAQFGVSADHLTAVNSYQFYREYALDEADPNNLTEVLWAVVAAGVVDDANVQSVIVPTIDNTESNWTVRASTSSEISDKAAKEAGDAVATVVFGAAEKAASGSFDLSAASNVVSAAAIDNIAPSALDNFAAGSGEAGIKVSWTAPEDHGIVGSYDIFGATHYIHGVDAYEVYRRIKGGDEFVLVGSAVPGSELYVDEMKAGATVYQYFVKAVDGNPDHLVETATRSAIAATTLSGDFSGDAIVNASDFSIFAANYGAVNKGNEANYVWAYDLNADGVVNASDFSIFAAGYGATLKLAKAAALEMPTSEIPFAMGATIDESTSTYFLNVNIGETETLKGFEFYLSYNTEALEFVDNSVNGLVGLNMTNVDEDGIIRVSDWFAGEQFDGTVTLAFRSTGVNSTLTFEILNALVDDVDGLALSTNVSDYEVRALPTVYALSQNYPNPFNPTTTIDYSIPKSGNVELVIFNMTGQKVRTLISGKQDAAFYKIVWDGRNDLGENVASGMYFYRLASGNFSKIAKMILIK